MPRVLISPMAVCGPVPLSPTGSTMGSTRPAAAALRTTLGEFQASQTRSVWIEELPRLTDVYVPVSVLLSLIIPPSWLGLAAVSPPLSLSGEAELCDILE